MLLMRGNEEIKLLTRTRSGSSCSVRTASYSGRIYCTVLQVLGGGKREAKITWGSRVRKQEKKWNIRSRFQEGWAFLPFLLPHWPKDSCRWVLQSALFKVKVLPQCPPEGNQPVIWRESLKVCCCGAYASVYSVLILQESVTSGIDPSALFHPRMM